MNRIDNVKSLFLTTILFLLLLNGCQISSIPPSLEQQSASPLTQGTLPNQPIRIITPSPINDQIDEESTGPGLLIKDDTNPDQLLWLLDISTQKIEPFTLPPDLTITSLSKGASPDKSNFVLTNLPSASLANHSLYIFNYQKNEIQVEIQLSPIEPVDFSKIYDSLADEIRTLMLDRNYGIWMLKESAANSMNSFHWAHDGNSVYHAETGLDGYTYLFQYDLITRKNNQLESQPYFLEAVKPSPDNSSLLVIKSLLTQVFDFPIKSAFVITENNELIQLPIPEQQEGEIIELSWFDSDNILISIFNSLEFSYTQLGYFNLLDQQ
ncbi:MAG: hypothetical protein MUO40_07555, partial [Anaerolineaceae bacterium]|nr:hypothetical protein [Anaerolineaceae bacterium]